MCSAANIRTRFLVAVGLYLPGICLVACCDATGSMAKLQSIICREQKISHKRQAYLRGSSFDVTHGVSRK